MLWFKSQLVPCALTWLACSVLGSNAQETAPDSNELFVPPPGLKFRLIAYQGGKAIFANNDRDPKNTLQLYPGEKEKFADQWWTLQDASDGRSFIKSTYRPNDNSVMFANQKQLGMWKKDFKDQHFTFEKADGKAELDEEGDYFRVVVPEENMVLVARSGDTRVDQYHADGPKYTDQYFSFDFEDTDVYDMKFDLSQSRKSEPEVMVVKGTAINQDTRPASQTVTINDELTEKSKFEFTAGYSFSLTTSFTVNIIPEVVSGTVQATHTLAFSTTMGKETERKKGFASALQITVPPRTKSVVEGRVNRWTLDVPVTLYSRPKWDKKHRVKIVTKALYKGVALSEIDWINKPAQNLTMS